MNDLRQAAQQALEAMHCAVPTGKITLADWHKSIAELEAVLAQQVKHVAWMRPWFPVRAQQAEQAWVCPESPKHRYTKPGYCEDCGKTLVQQAEPDHETRAELAEQQVVQLAEERDHYRNLWQKAQQAEPVEPMAWAYMGIKQDGTEHGPHLVWKPEYMDFMSASKGAKATPLYTAPPQRKPLTEEEIVEAVREADLDWQAGWTLDEHEPNRFTTLVRAVERAHGITGDCK